MPDNIFFYIAVAVLLFGLAAAVKFYLLPRLEEDAEAEPEPTHAEVEDFEARNPPVEDTMPTQPISRIFDQSEPIGVGSSDTLEDYWVTMGVKRQPEVPTVNPSLVCIAFGAVAAVVTYLILRDNERV